MNDANLFKTVIDEAKARRRTDMPSCKCAEQDYCGCNGKRDIAIIADSKEQGKTFAIERGLKMVRIYDTPKSLKECKFEKDKTVYLIADRYSMWKAFLTTRYGAKIVLANDWQYDI